MIRLKNKKHSILWVAPLVVIVVLYSAPLAQCSSMSSNSSVKDYNLSLNRYNIYCRVWGLLKYLAPVPISKASKSYSWDNYITVYVPQMEVDSGSHWFNGIVSAMIGQAGISLRGDSLYHVDTPYAWLNTDTVLNRRNKAALLNCIRTAKPKDEYYFSYTEEKDPLFQNEKTDSNAFPPVSQRLVTLFRYWNIVNYFYPNKKGLNWDSVLDAFIPKMLYAKDTAEYQLAVLELCMSIKDAHSFTYSRFTNEYFGTGAIPLALSYIENKTVVSSVSKEYPELKPGTIIETINGVNVAKLRERLAPYVPQSNDASLERNINNFLLRGQTGDSAILGVRYKNDSFHVTLPYTDITPHVDTDGQMQTFALLHTDSIAYLKVYDLDKSDVSKLLPRIQNTKGLILDVRGYPHGVMFALDSFLVDRVPCAWFYSPNISSLGSFLPIALSRVGNKKEYFGKVVVLMNELTQSHAEYTCMAFKAIPGSVFIGSQTAGADGDVTHFPLPGGFVTNFSGLGMTYPDGKPTQRVGILPDIYIKPTIDDLINGRDPVLEKAEEIILQSK